MARSATGARPLLWTIAGAVVGAVAAVGLAVAGWPHPSGPEPVAAPSDAAAREFVARWSQMRLATWAMEARFTRETSTGRRLDTRLHMAQRPPDRLVTGLGSIDARRGGERLACAPDAAGTVRCRNGGPAPPYESEVQRELANLRRYVLGPGALYAVVHDGDCFLLRLRLRILSPPYGERARFCFDRQTGAPVRSEVDRREARDLTVATSVRARPSEADLDPERWGGGGRG